MGRGDWGGLKGYELECVTFVSKVIGILGGTIFRWRLGSISLIICTHGQWWAQLTGGLG